jgi:predicted ABC-type ATPase
MHPQNKISPEIIVFAGPNGSGKSTITKMAKVIEMNCYVETHTK